MRDPFPIPPYPPLAEAVKPWAEYLSLTTLPLHIHEILFIAVFYHFAQIVISPWLSRIFFPVRYASLSGSKKVNWDVHVVSLFQSTLLSVVALYVMAVDKERGEMDWQERVWGYTGASGMVQALATGYFVWDLQVTVTNLHLFGLGMLAHAICALVVYSFGFRPFVNFYSISFILWEISSPFLNIHWFFDKLGMTGSRGQLYNGLLLIFSFFSCRLVWGTYQSFMVARDVITAMQHPLNLHPSSITAQTEAAYSPRYEETMRFAVESSTVPIWLASIYLGANLTLNFLNFYWILKMIKAVRKRFEPSRESGKGASKIEITESMATGNEISGQSLKARQRSGSLLDGEEVDDPPPT